MKEAWKFWNILPFFSYLWTRALEGAWLALGPLRAHGFAWAPTCARISFAACTPSRNSKPLLVSFAFNAAGWLAGRGCFAIFQECLEGYFCPQRYAGTIPEHDQIRTRFDFDTRVCNLEYFPY